MIHFSIVYLYRMTRSACVALSTMSRPYADTRSRSSIVGLFFQNVSCAIQLIFCGILIFGVQELQAANVKDVKIAIIQYAFQWQDEAKQDAFRFEGMIREAAAKGAQLIVGPENCLYRYSPWESNGVTELYLAQQFENLVQKFSALANELNVCVVFGLREPSGDPQRPTYQSAVFIDNRGQVLKVYRKRVPSSAEAGYTKSGGNEWNAFDSPFGRVFLQICRDMDDGTYASLMPIDTDLLIGLNSDKYEGWVNVATGCENIGCYGIGANWSNANGSIGGNSGFVDPTGKLISEAGLGEKIVYETLPLPVVTVTPPGAAGVYSDDFSQNHLSDYTVVNTWTAKGVGRFLYDAAGQRLKVLTGDDVGLQFGHDLPASQAGVLEFDFLPTVKHPNGGIINLILRQDADNYYLISNRDGYGPGAASKVVGGQTVEQTGFQSEYRQNSNYHIRVSFSPTATVVEAFGEVLTFSGDKTPLMLNRFEIELRQQDGYFDNISFSSTGANFPPTADAGADRTAVAGDAVILDGSASADVDGVLAYFWQQTAGSAVGFDASAVKPSFTAPGVSGSMEVLEFILTVTDDHGASDSDTVAVTVTPPGAAGVYSDDFSQNHLSDYTVVNTWTAKGVGQFLYDAAGQRLKVLTGDDVGLQFGHDLPASQAGVLEFDFLPTVKHPNGGIINLILRQDADNYYLISNRDGYGPGAASKVVGGQTVEQTGFQSEYRQNSNYHIRVSFSPTATVVEAFGEVLTFSGDKTPLMLNRFEIELRQQDGYFDNISFSSTGANFPPTADAGADRTAVAGDAVILDGSASADVDGVLAYFWQQTAGSAVGFDASAVKPSFTAPGVSGSMEVLEFILTVTDDHGASDSDTVAVTVTPPGAAGVYSDDFSQNHLSDYTVVNTWTAKGVGQFLYDAAGQRLKVLTGDDVGLQFGHDLPASQAGVLEFDFLPTVKHPNGGIINLILRQDADNYYLISNRDGYGPGAASKVVGGQTVEQTGFQSEYRQNSNYHIRVSFSPTATVVEAFGEVLTFSGDKTPLMLNRFEIELRQQDGYFDNISFSSTGANFPPTADAGADRTAVAGDAVILDGSASADVDGVLAYFWQQTAGSAVGFDASAVKPSFTAPGVSGSMEVLEFILTVTDDHGASDSDTVAVTVTPPGAAGVYSDDFSQNHLSDYTVVNTWTAKGVGQFLYDAAGQRLKVLTGDDVGLQFGHDLPASQAGVLEFDFLPTVKHPNGGIINLILRQDADNYYLISNRDGYGPGAASKVVGGQTVEQTGFQSEYRQNSNYHIRVSFSPTATVVEAFGEVLTFSGDKTPLMLNRFEIELRQQDGYFDNILFTNQPFVSIISPSSYYLQGGTNLKVQALSGNLQTGWGVQFALGDNETQNVQIFSDFVEPFEHTFENLMRHDYTIEASIIDSDFKPVPGDFAYDLKEPVGIGDYYVAFGASISEGYGDDMPLDDMSTDSRNFGGGYLPILNDLLTAAKGYPHTIVNEGVGGEDSSDALARVYDVLAAHPQAQYFIILLGTNDSRISSPTPSGLKQNGELLSPDDPGYKGSYLDNMQQIIDAIITAGKVPILGKLPITFGPCSTCTPFPYPDEAARNLLIQEYNMVIDALVAKNGIGIDAPDFYEYYRTNPDEFSDNLHPNGLGYQSMAGLWFDAIMAAP